ncbi:MAG TPA: transcriptional repressor NrdR [Desulfuromonadales bacterium]|nr:transcriptional repressor NrdR [Desulfuromonadales bacterium]
MKCPFCNNLDSKVVDSRPDKGGSAIRRRRECEQCSKRFTTHERIEEMLPQVCKKDGRREPFDRIKIINGIVKACEKRPIPKSDIEALVDRLEMRLQEATDREISTTVIGEWVMKELHGMDEVAYVRFASVYRSFRDISEFMKELQELLKK